MPCQRKYPQAPTMSGAGGDNAGIPTGTAHRLPYVAERILQHEAPDARAGVEHRQYKERLKHDGKVVPDGHHRGATQAVRKNLGHAQGKGRRTAGAEEERLLADVVRQRGHLIGW